MDAFIGRAGGSTTLSSYLVVAILILFRNVVLRHLRVLTSPSSGDSASSTPLMASASRFVCEINFAIDSPAEMRYDAQSPHGQKVRSLKFWNNNNVAMSASVREYAERLVNWTRGIPKPKTLGS